MGKKVINQASSLKISKDIIHEKQHFNNLIKVLKPKVYITKTTNFKKLVQELTGNGNNINNTLSPTTLEVPKVVDENHCNVFVESPSFENSSFSTEATTSTNSSNTCEFSCDALLNEEFNQVCNQLCLDDDDDQSLFFQDSMANYYQPIDELLAFQNIESLLFDVDQLPNPFYNYCEEIEVQDVSIYDYELSGLL
ncbi:hypothetical protein L195_g008523 [Trifolium pratense]|uniref:VQ domain-containing protein n=1 Tax=Trifolium pratense TaxID=57577 RepID=A0A2K3P9E6_TRIPR|nr:hypothetical protein L195_g008523 [Trifolium pratense]